MDSDDLLSVGAGTLGIALYLAYVVVLSTVAGAIIGLLPVFFGALRSRGDLGAAAWKRCVLLALIPIFGWLIAIVSAILDSVKIAQSSEQVGPTRRKCPHCAELILREAKVCKHCGRDVMRPNVQPPSISQA